MSEIEYMKKDAELILEKARKFGAEAAQVEVNFTFDIGTRYGEKHITQNISTSHSSFRLTSKIGNKVGTFSGSILADGLDKEIENAMLLTKLSAPDEDFPGFIKKQPTYPPLNTSFEKIEPEVLAEAIDQIIDYAINVDSRISSVAGNLHYVANRRLYLNSYGVEAFDENAVISGVINVAATENSESRSTAKIGGQTIDQLKLQQNSENVAKTAVMGLEPKEIEAGTYEVILQPDAVAELASFVARGASSEGLITHSSFLKDKLGEKIFNKRISMTDDTQNEVHIAQRRFDSEGVPSPSIKFIDGGVLKDYAYNRRNAKKLEVDSNGKHFAGFGGETALFTAITIAQGDKSLDQLIEEIDEGVLITNLFYNNFVNPPEGLCTGLTRDGLFKIEDGEIVSSLKNMRWTDKILKIFNEAEPATNPRQVKGFFFGSTITPSIRVNSFNFSSKGKH